MNLGSSITEYTLYKESLKQSRWSYYNYGLILLAWMLNDFSMVLSVSNISHEGFHFRGLMYILTVILIGVPIVFSEICLAQYTNCDVVTLWNFFPLFRSLGYGSTYLLVLKMMYLFVLNYFYALYTYHAMSETPPWFTCKYFNTSLCMVKHVNISIFQYCVEAQTVFGDDCQMKTASAVFFEEIIGNLNTKTSFNCMLSWRGIFVIYVIGFIMLLLMLKRYKTIDCTVKILLICIAIIGFIMSCVGAASKGIWLTSRNKSNEGSYTIKNSVETIRRAFLSMGTGYGVILFYSSHVGFRSPANMVAIAAPLLSSLLTIVLSFVIYSGITTMSYFHGGEENVLEVGVSAFFSEFASISEVTSYFEGWSGWGALWFLMIFLILFCNLWIALYYFTEMLMENFECFNRYPNSCIFFLILVLGSCSIPFQCSDMICALTDVVEIIQTFHSILFSFALYWIYGQSRHRDDIIFMIGVKSGYIWRTSWMLHPIILTMMLYFKLSLLTTAKYEDSYMILGTYKIDKLMVYFLLGVYILVVFIGMLITIIKHLHTFRSIFKAEVMWGPRDLILFKSRKMFNPKVMTREFLYRQVRIQGYTRRDRSKRTSLVDVETYEDLTVLGD